jgi:outer membrane immunogenic protein
MHRIAFVLLASASLLAGYCQSASAADLARKAPIYKAPLLSPEPAARWTGLYVGGNIGYGVARDPSSLTHLIANIPFSGDTFNLNSRGVLGGAQIGYNWQPSPQWVVGVEADIQGADQSASVCVTACRVDGVQLFSRVTQELPWFGTVRARVGWTDGPTLYYLTGGLAYGRVTMDVTVDHIAQGPATRSFSHDKTGWVVGAGIETELTGNWRVKAEYLYVDLGSVNDAFVAPSPGNLNSLRKRDQKSHCPPRPELQARPSGSVVGLCVGADQGSTRPHGLQLVRLLSRRQSRLRRGCEPHSGKRHRERRVDVCRRGDDLAPWRDRRRPDRVQLA